MIKLTLKTKEMISRFVVPRLGLKTCSTSAATRIVRKTAVATTSVLSTFPASSSSSSSISLFLCNTRTLLSQKEQQGEEGKSTNDLEPVPEGKNPQHSSSSSSSATDEVTLEGEQQDQQQQQEDEEASFDITEATLQEIHDLVVAMHTHKHNSIKKIEHRFPEHEVAVYSRMSEWDRGHALFEEWMDKLEKLLTKDIMKALMKSAEWEKRHPIALKDQEDKIQRKKEQQQQQQQQRQEGGGDEGDDSSSSSEQLPPAEGFRRNPASYSYFNGAERPLRRYAPSNIAMTVRRREQNSAAKFFMHAPYQVQLARPDASPELVAQSRSWRDRDTLRCIVELTEEREAANRPRCLPRKDRIRLIRIFSDVTGWCEDESLAQM